MFVIVAAWNDGNVQTVGEYDDFNEAAYHFRRVGALRAGRAHGSRQASERVWGLTNEDGWSMGLLILVECGSRTA